MDDFKHLCPVCQTGGKTTFLQLRQINLTTAVYLCKDIKCLYPLGHSWIFVDRDLFNIDDDQCDSDVSDNVNDDIEKMQNTIDEASVLIAMNNTEITNDNIVNELKLNEEKFDTTEYQENNNTRRINSDGPFTNIVEKSGKTVNNINEEHNYNLHVDLAEHNVYRNSNLQATPFENATHLSSASKVENIIIDDPDGLYKILNTSYSANTTGAKPKVLASGAQGTETLNLTLSKSADVNCHFGKSDNPNNIKLDIQLKTQTQDNIIEIEDNEDINGLETPKINNLKIVPEKQIKTLRSFKKIGDINIKDSVIKIDNTISETEYKNMEQFIERRKIANIKKLKKNSRKKPKTVADHLILPSVKNTDNDFSLRLKNVDIENLLKTKLKISAKRENTQEFCFSDTILREAAEIAKEDASKIDPKGNRSIVNLIEGQNKKKTVYKNNAYCFEGFKYSSEIIKAAPPPTNKKVEQPIKVHNQTQFKKQFVNNKCQRKLVETNLRQKQSTIVPSNICVSGESATSDNINFGDEALSAFFDNIDKHQVNAPNNNVNIEEIDELLTSLCQ